MELLGTYRLRMTIRDQLLRRGNKNLKSPITEHRSPKERFHRRRDMQAAQFIRSQASRLWTLKLAEREEVGASRSFCGEESVSVRSFFFRVFFYYCCLFCLSDQSRSHRTAGNLPADLIENQQRSSSCLFGFLRQQRKKSRCMRSHARGAAHAQLCVCI